MALADRLQIDLSRLKEFLRIDFDDSDRELLDFIRAAKEQIELFLNHDFTEIGPEGELVEKPIPFSISLALYRMIGAWYDNRTAGITHKNIGGVSFNVSEIPYDARALLTSYRKLPGL